MSVLEPGQPPILVGIDGSRSSRAALRWAYGEAARTAAPLQVLTTWPTVSRDAAAIETEDQARAVATQAITTELPSDHGAVKVWVSALPGEAADVLLRLAREAQLVVVGPHSSHSMLEHLLGSVSQHVLARAACPVAVVRADADTAPLRHRVVVGVDGSPASLAALDWAARYALATEAKVEALLVWDWRPEYGVYPYGPDERQQHARAEATLAGSLVTLPEAARQTVRGETARGHAADILLHASEAADPIVVGDSRPAHLASHLLGSVSHKIAQHARTPVIVTRATVDRGW